MDTIKQLERYKPAPNTSMARRATDWSVMSNKALKFALDKLELHHSPYVGDVLNEIQQRAARGAWLDLEDHTPTTDNNVPGWLRVFPFCLLWKQRP